METHLTAGDATEIELKIPITLTKVHSMGTEEVAPHLILEIVDTIAQTEIMITDGARNHDQAPDQAAGQVAETGRPNADAIDLMTVPATGQTIGVDPIARNVQDGTSASGVAVQVTIYETVGLLIQPLTCYKQSNLQT